MKRITTFLIAALLGLLSPLTMLAQDNKVEPDRQTVSTVYGGTSTGLFNTLGTRTLKAGEYNFGAFWNNFDRDPGDLDINQVPLNIGVGLTDRWEVWANVDVFQQVTSRQPLTLSGPQFNGVRSMFNNNAFAAFGPPVGGRRNDTTAYFPGSHALGGGILPPVGAFFGGLVSNRPSFYNDLPFFGPAVFNPGTGNYDVQRSGSGLGNVTLGTKVNLVKPDRAFSLAVAGLFRFPTTNSFHGMSHGRGSGEFDYGPVLILGQSAAGQRVRVTQNLGYFHSGDPDVDGVKILDRRDALLMSAGIEVSPHQKVVLLGELDGTIYVGSGTPNLNPVNPVDLVLGLCDLAWDGKFNLGAGYRRFLNSAGDRTIPGTRAGLGLVNIPVGTGDVNGFVFNFGFGRRVDRTPPPPPNRPPSCNLEANPNPVQVGGRVTIASRASDPDNDVINFTWATSAGQITGSGPTVELDTSSISMSPGADPVKVNVKLTVDDGKGGTNTCDGTITVTAEPPPPPKNRPPSIQSVSCNQVVGTPLVPGQVTDGETVRMRATASDPDGDSLTYQWNASAGQLRGSGSNVTLDTTGVTGGPGSQPATINITVTVSDGRGETDSATCSLTVHSGAKPEIEKVQMDLTFPRGGARVDNEHKALLDDVALRLQQEPRAKLIVFGHVDRGELKRLAQQRADNVKAYLVKEKGIDADRIIICADGDHAKNPIVEMWIVPSGAETPSCEQLNQ